MVQRLAAILRVPLSQITKAIESRKGDPLTPITVQNGRPDGARALPGGAPGGVPGRLGGDDVPAELPVQVARRPGARPRRRDLGGPAEGEGGRGLPRRRPDRPGGRRGGVRPVPARHAGAGAAPRRLARPAAEPVPGAAVPGAGQRASGSRSTSSSSGRPSRRSATGSSRALENDNWWANGGAIVALDPHDGEVLALASNPTFKPCLYVGRPDAKQAARARRDAGRELPALNRATSGRYPPGSTWKPVTALAAMQEHLLSPYQAIPCTPFSVYGRDKPGLQQLEPVRERAR